MANQKRRRPTNSMYALNHLAVPGTTLPALCPAHEDRPLHACADTLPAGNVGPGAVRQEALHRDPPGPPESGPGEHPHAPPQAPVF